MHRIDHPTAENGLFTEGNPTTGLPATVVTDDWLNSVQEEVANFLEATGIVLNKTNLEQLGDAMARKSSQNLLFAPGVNAPSAATTFNFTPGQDLPFGGWVVLGSQTSVTSLQVLVGIGGTVWMKGTAPAGSKIQFMPRYGAQSSYLPGEQGLGLPGGYNAAPAWKDVFYTESYELAAAPASIPVVAKFGDHPSQGTPKFLYAPAVTGGNNARPVRVIAANAGDTTQNGLISSGFVVEFTAAGSFDFVVYNMQQIAGWHEKPPRAFFSPTEHLAQMALYYEELTGYYVINQPPRRDGAATSSAIYDLTVNYAKKAAAPSAVTVEILEQKYWGGYQFGWLDANPADKQLAYNANGSVFAENSAVLNFYDGPEAGGEAEGQVIWRVKLKITVKV